MIEFDGLVEAFKKWGIHITNIFSDFVKKSYALTRNTLGKKDAVQKPESKISPEVLSFLTYEGIDTDNIPDCLNIMVQGSSSAKKNDYEYTLLSNSIFYDNSNMEKVLIKDIVGSSKEQDDIPLLEFVSSLYHSKFEYGSRGLDYLGMSVKSNLDNINNSVIPVNFMKLGDKYYVIRDGNHRAFYLLLVYLIRKHIYNDHEKMLQEIEKEFVINARVQKKSRYVAINKIFYCLLKSGNYDLKIEFTNNENGIAILRYEGKEIIINSEQEFLQIFNKYLSTLDKNSDKYKRLFSWLSYVGYFGSNLNQQNNVQEMDGNRKL